MILCIVDVGRTDEDGGLVVRRKAVRTITYLGGACEAACCEMFSLRYGAVTKAYFSSK